jgi:RNA polymerase sigma-70 factor (ECF subfamily)
MMPVALSLPQSITTSQVPDLTDSDRELVAQAQRDVRAFAHLYARYLDRIHQYCYRRLGTREAAEDATSQIFVQAMSGLPRFDARGGAFRSWLFTIAHNVVIDHYRAAKPAGWFDEALDLPDRDPSPEEQAISSDASRILRAAIAQLPERQRQVVELRLAGLTGPEIGQVLGCRTRTVDVAQFRAVARLRTLLADDRDDNTAGEARHV